VIQISQELLGETIVTLERVECQSWACTGPTLTPIPMVTCYVCETLAKLQALLIPQPKDDTPDDRFDEQGNLVRCICGSELKSTSSETAQMYGFTKVCPQCAREYS
jgi:hypothetical protein